VLKSVEISSFLSNLWTLCHFISYWMARCQFH